jgi:AMMECR1 domain-containing protein
MKEIVSQILTQYFIKMREPKLEELTIDEKYASTTGCCFVTLYINGEVRWSAGNIKEIHPNIVSELISNTMQALTSDKRFTPLTMQESEKIQFRVDTISHRDMISLKDVSACDPTKNGVIAINRSYEKLAVVLPNMSPKLMTWDDIIPVLRNKLEDKKIEDKNYIFYKIETTSETNF